jgi:hypothetical protein
MAFNHARHISQLVLAFVCLLQLIPAAGAESTPSFTIAEPEITLAPGATEGTGSLLLSAEKLDSTNIAKPLEEPKALKTGLVPGDIKFEAHEVDHTDNTRRWILTTDIKGLPDNVTQKRYLTFKFDGRTVLLPFTLSNKNPATFAWSVKAPAEVSLPPGEPLEISIALQGVGATKIGLLQSSLLEQSRKRPVKGGWILCKERVSDPTPCAAAGQELSLPPHTSQRLWLYPAQGSTLIGKYMGNVIVKAAEKPDGETLPVTIYGTNACRQFLGVLAIMLGVFCAWLVTVYLQNRLNRDQLLLPAIMLKEQFEELRDLLNNRPRSATAFDCAQTLRAIDKSERALSENELDANNLLPSSMPNPFKGAGPNADGYKQLIALQGARFESLQLIVKSGFKAIWSHIPAAPTDVQQTAIATAFAAVDNISSEDPLPSAHDLDPRLKAILTTLDTALGGSQIKSLSATSSQQSRSSEQVTAEIRAFSGLAWSVFGLFATALGAYVLILSNLGFGTFSDYLICLFWGIGLPISGTTLAQSTTGSAATALGFSIPKAS